MYWADPAANPRITPEKGERMEGGQEGGEEIKVGDKRRLTARSVISNTVSVNSHIHILFHERKKKDFFSQTRAMENRHLLQPAPCACYRRCPQVRMLVAEFGGLNLKIGI